jgi:hypothetical protein
MLPQSQAYQQGKWYYVEAIGSDIQKVVLRSLAHCIPLLVSTVMLALLLCDDPYLQALGYMTLLIVPHSQLL